ncbi:MAG: isoprenylcysteine carboxylmethyltransferase family protein [Caldilineaceae bacterium]
MMNVQKIMPPTYALLSLLLMVGLHLVFPMAQIIGPQWRLAGVLLIGVGLAMNIVASNVFKTRQTTIKPYEAPTVLVTTGFFRLSRNPMYLGGVLLLTGAALLLGSLTPFGVIPLFIALLNEGFIKKEERILAATLGEPYLAYQKQVRRWI